MSRAVDALIAWGEERRQAAERGQAAHRVGALGDEPEVAVRSGVDPGRADRAHREDRDDTRRGDPPDRAVPGAGDPEVAVRSDGDLAGLSTPVAGNEVTPPVTGFTRPTLSLSWPTSQRLPSGPVTIPRGLSTGAVGKTVDAPVVAPLMPGTGVDRILPAGGVRTKAFAVKAVAQMFPSGPTVMPTGRSRPEAGKSVAAPAVVTR